MHVALKTVYYLSRMENLSRKESEVDRKELTRREFLGTTGVGLAAGLVAATPFAGTTAETELPASDLADLNVRRISELDKLPWFEKDDDGNIRLKAGSGVPPIIDFHAHVGWNYGFGRTIDMRKRSAVKYFYEFEVEQDVVFQQNHPTKKEARALTWEILQTLFMTPQRNFTHTAANLMAELDRMNCRNICLHPIEIPFMSQHAERTLEASRLDSRFIPFAAVYPKPWSEQKETQLKSLIDRGARGLKFHPEFQFTAPDNKDAMEMFAWCEANNVLVFAHTGYTGSELPFMQYMAEPVRYGTVLRAFPKLRMVFAHTGIRRREDAIAVARRYEDQVWLEISGQDANAIRLILDSYDKKKVLYGSDWPFFPLAVMIARALVATEDDLDLRDDLFHDNAARLLGFSA